MSSINNIQLNTNQPIAKIDEGPVVEVPKPPKLPDGNLAKLEGRVQLTSSWSELGKEVAELFVSIKGWVDQASTLFRGSSWVVDQAETLTDRLVDEVGKHPAGRDVKKILEKVQQGIGEINAWFEDAEKVAKKVDEANGLYGKIVGGLDTVARTVGLHFKLKALANSKEKLSSYEEELGNVPEDDPRRQELSSAIDDLRIRIDLETKKLTHTKITTGLGIGTQVLSVLKMVFKEVVKDPQIPKKIGQAVTDVLGVVSSAAGLLLGSVLFFKTREDFLEHKAWVRDFKANVEGNALSAQELLTKRQRGIEEATEKLRASEEGRNAAVTWKIAQIQRRMERAGIPEGIEEFRTKLEKEYGIPRDADLRDTAERAKRARRDTLATLLREYVDLRAELETDYGILEGADLSDEVIREGLEMSEHTLGMVLREYVNHQQTIEVTTRDALVAALKDKHKISQTFWNFKMTESSGLFAMACVTFAATVVFFVLSAVGTPFLGAAAVMALLGAVSGAFSLGTGIAATVLNAKYRSQATYALKTHWAKVQLFFTKIHRLIVEAKLLNITERIERDPDVIDLDAVAIQQRRSERLDGIKKKVEDLEEQIQKATLLDLSEHAPIAMVEQGAEGQDAFDTFSAAGEALALMDFDMIDTETKRFLEHYLNLDLSVCRAEAKKGAESLKKLFSADEAKFLSDVVRWRNQKNLPAA